MAPMMAEYRRLLTGGESLAQLEAAIRLARRIASGTGRRSGWQALLNGEAREVERAAAKRAGAAEGGIERRVEEVVGVLRLGRRAVEMGEAMPEAQYSLLMDTLLVVFHQAYFALLPKVRARAQRERLLRSFEAFGDAGTEARDAFQIRGLMKLERGEFAAAAENFRAAVGAVHADEEDFLTRVQMLWTLLMTRGRADEAFAFLLETLPLVSWGDREEFLGLLRETYEESHRMRDGRNVVRGRGRARGRKSRAERTSR